MNVEVYTDGSATTKNKPGGWAWVIVVDGKEHSSGSGSMPNATNNDAELEAAIMGLANALAYVHKNYPPFTTGIFNDSQGQLQVTLCSDSEIILKWANGTNRFKQADKMVKYYNLQQLMKRMKVWTRWVEGHAGHEFNEKCDKMAKAERNKAMGIVPKKRVNRTKELEKVCKIMADALDYVHRVALELEHDHQFPRHDLEDKASDALQAYSQYKEKFA